MAETFQSSATNPYAPPRAAVRDIATPYTSAALADPGTRLGAAILDSIIGMTMVYLPGLVVIWITAAAGPRSGDGMVGAGLLMMLVGLAAWLWLTIKYVNANGQSIAKKLLGIKVVRSDGSPVSLGRLFWLRNVVNSLISIVPGYGLVELLFIFGESRQCLHDKLADTIVIKA
jgi:uncharacterized RDD family membrane protein YckC